MGTVKPPLTLKVALKVIEAQRLLIDEQRRQLSDRAKEIENLWDIIRKVAT